MEHLVVHRFVIRHQFTAPVCCGPADAVLAAGGILPRRGIRQPQNKSARKVQPINPAVYPYARGSAYKTKSGYPLRMGAEFDMINYVASLHITVQICKGGYFTFTASGCSTTTEVRGSFVFVGAYPQFTNECEESQENESGLIRVSPLLWKVVDAAVLLSVPVSLELPIHQILGKDV